MKSCSAEVI